MIPAEVENLQSQLVEGHLAVEEFFAIILQSYELELCQVYLKTVIHNLRVLMTETIWGQKYRKIFLELVDAYQNFFCEEIDHTENIERHDWRAGLENQQVNFDDENIFEEIGDSRYLEASDDFKDDGGCESEETKLAFNLSRMEVGPTSKSSSKTKTRKKKLNSPKESPVLLWFRRDLRTYDNQALVKACSLGVPVIPVFLWNEAEEGPLAAGGAVKVWLEQGLHILSRTLQERYESKLIFRKTYSYKSELLNLVRETGAKTVVWTALYEPLLVSRDREIKKALEKIGVEIAEEHGYLLHRPDQVSVAKIGAIGIGSVTHFMECCKQNPGDKIGDPVDPPMDIPKPKSWPSSCLISELCLYKKPRRRDGTLVDWAAGIQKHWRFGEEGGYENLRRFLDENVDKYESESARADQAWTAVISPYLHWGELSPRLVLHEAFVGKIAAKFRRKLAWRDLSYWLLSMFPDMDSQPIRPPFTNMAWNTDLSQLTRWERGNTGFPLVDAAMRQLWAIGWINNYMRHVVASFLMSYLRFSWVEGYKWFQDTLLDADVAINAMMWQNGGFSGLDQWNFVMHPVNAAMTCDPKGDYVRRWIPELSGLPDKFIHQPWKCPSTILKRNNVQLGVNYPNKCVVDLEKAREQSLQDVVDARNHFGKTYIDPKYGRDMVPIKFTTLGLKGPKSGKDMVMIPLITRKEFIYKTMRPDAKDNPYNPVLKGYVSRDRDEEVERLSKVDFTASTMREIAVRKERVDRINGVQPESSDRVRGSFGGKGRPQRKNVRV